MRDGKDAPGARSSHSTASTLQDLARLLARQAAAEYLSAIGQEPSRQPSIRIPPSFIKGATGEHEPEVAG